MAVPYVKVAVLESSGLTGDPLSTNPYVVIAAGKARYKTNVQQTTVDPIWEEAFSVNMEDTKKLLVTVWNKSSDPSVSDIFLGLMTLDSSNMMLDGTKNWFKLNPRRGKDDVVSGEICLSFVPSASANETKNAPKGDIKKMEAEVKERVTEAVSQNVLELELSGLGLTIVPSALRSYHMNWINLDLGFNKFVTWPNIAEFGHLEELWLTGNQLTELGNDLESLKKLKTLYLNGNQLVRLNDSVGQLVSLEKLDAANNQIAEISPKIGNLRSLEELNLSGNPLQTLPTTIGKLEFLEVLDLGGCALNYISKDFCNLTRLLELNLGNNKLTKLHDDFGKLTRLVSLNLSDNLLTDLPLSMGACVHLDSVLIDRNPIKDQDMLKKYGFGTDHLMDYLGKRMFASAQEEKKRKRQQEREGKAAAEKAKKDEVLRRAEEEDLEGWEEVEEEVDENDNLTDDEKKAKIRSHSQKLAGECRNEVITLKRNLAKVTTLEEIIPIAKAIRDLIPHMNVARQQMAPIAKPKPPLFTGNEDKVAKLKMTTAVAIREFESVLAGIFNVVSGNATLEQLVPLSGVITGSLSILQNVTKDMDNR